MKLTKARFCFKGTYRENRKEEEDEEDEKEEKEQKAARLGYKS